MRTAEEILESHLIESDSGFERGVYIDGHGNYNGVIKAMKEYAKEVAKEALKNASRVCDALRENGDLVKQIILNESNLPKL